MVDGVCVGKCVSIDGFNVMSHMSSTPDHVCDLCKKSLWPLFSVAY